MLHCNNSIPEKRCRNTFFLITSLFAKGFQLQDMQWNRNDKCDWRNACKSFIRSQAACNTWKCVCYSVTREIWKSHKKSGKSQEALTWLVLQNGSVYQLELPKMITLGSNNVCIYESLTLVFMCGREREIYFSSLIHTCTYVCMVSEEISPRTMC